MSFPGLPSLSAANAELFTAIALITEDGDLSASQYSSQWGIFLDGSPVVVADNVLSMEFKQDFKISNYPVEQGGFASYNKVQLPFEVRFRFSTGGSSADRAAMLNSIAAVMGDTNLYDVVTPDATYINVNFVHQDYRRTAETGNGLLSVDVWCEEVRSASLIVSSSGTATSSTTTPDTSGSTSASSSTPNSIVANDFDAINNPQSASASPQVNGGNVQPQTPTSIQTSTFDSNAGF